MVMNKILVTETAGILLLFRDLMEDLYFQDSLVLVKDVLVMGTIQRFQLLLIGLNIKFHNKT